MFTVQIIVKASLCGIFPFSYICNIIILLDYETEKFPNKSLLLCASKVEIFTQLELYKTLFFLTKRTDKETEFCNYVNHILMQESFGSSTVQCITPRFNDSHSMLFYFHNNIISTMKLGLMLSYHLMTVSDSEHYQ